METFCDNNTIPATDLLLICLKFGFDQLLAAVSYKLCRVATLEVSTKPTQRLL